MAVRDFAAAFPDEKRWFTRLTSEPTETLKDFLGSLGYTGRPELWSMFSCLLLTRSMWLNPDWYTHHATSLRNAMKSQSEHEIMRVPALCVQDVLATC